MWPEVSYPDCPCRYGDGSGALPHPTSRGQIYYRDNWCRGLAPRHFIVGIPGWTVDSIGRWHDDSGVVANLMLRPMQSFSSNFFCLRTNTLRSLVLYQTSPALNHWITNPYWLTEKHITMCVFEPLIFGWMYFKLVLRCSPHITMAVMKNGCSLKWLSYGSMSSLVIIYHVSSWQKLDCCSGCLITLVACPDRSPPTKGYKRSLATPSLN